MLRRQIQTLLFLVAHASFALALDPIPASEIFAPAGFYDAQISPDGRHLAVILDKGGQRIAVVMETEKLTVSTILRFDREQNVTSIRWANNKRLLAKLSQQSMFWGDFEVDTGDLFAMNFDGTRKKMIFGYRSTSTNDIYGHHEILHMLPDDPDHVVVQINPWGPEWGSLPEAHLLDINTGRLEKIVRGKVRNGYFLTDNEGSVRLNFGRDKEYNPVIYSLHGKDWLPVIIGDNTLEDVFPLSFISDSDHVYIAASSDGNPSGLYILDIQSGEVQELLEPKISGVREVWFATTDDQLVWAKSMPGREHIDYLVPEHREAKLDRALHKAFPGQIVEYLSATEDNSNITIRVSSDTNPGDFYLIDSKSMQATPLFSANQRKLTPLMRQMEPITFQARDGLQIHGYLTTPKEGPSPLVVFVHGGHLGDRHRFGYDSTVQYLVSRGYAVLQLNHRGSGGYGLAFSRKGLREWGGKIQEDISDGVHWAIDKGKALRNRVCIFGVSFGGYSAMMAPIRDPELFRCAIGFSGVYDLPLMRERGDINDELWGEDYFDMVLGNDEAALLQNSPTQLAEKLNLPVLIIHGEKDDRAPVEHAYLMKNALEKYGKTYEWHVEAGAGHRFGDYENRIEAYERMALFLDKYLGDDGPSEQSN